MSAKLLELQLTNICLGKVIPKIFVKKSVPGSISAIRRVKPYSMLARKLLFLYITLLSALTSIMRCETQSKRLQKLQNKAARVILGMTNDVNHTIALCALG